MTYPKLIICCVMMLVLSNTVSSEDCDADSDCGNDKGYTCRGGDVYKFIQNYYCDDGTCRTGDKDFGDEPYDVCDPWDHTECVEGKNKCQPMTLDILTTTTLASSTTSSTTSTTRTTTSSTTTSSSTSSTSSTTTSTNPPPTTTTTLAEENDGFMEHIIYKRPIEVNLEFIRALISAIVSWE
ncbi:MAG: hypothetical protein KKD39_04030 [Candidatus Altiarchaeota archaeon]|nr:hypothetical protein [Candidatus Altiarchaeota archaeon]